MECCFGFYPFTAKNFIISTIRYTSMMSKVLSYILTWYDIKTDLLMCMYNVYVWLGNILKMKKCVGDDQILLCQFWQRSQS